MRSRKNAAQRRAHKDRDAKLAHFWSGRIEAGQEARATYADRAAEVMAYFSSKHDVLFTNDNLRRSFMDFADVASVSVPKVAQMKNSLGPRLYLAEPERTIAPRRTDPVLVAFSKVLQTYVNYAAHESKFVQQLRNAVDDGLLKGRMFLQQKWDPVRKIIHSVHVPSLDVVFDPDFTKIEDAQWIAIRHREPLWKIKKRIKQKWRWEHLRDNRTIPGETDEGGLDKPNNADSRTCTVIEWWEVLSRMGCGFRGAAFDAESEYADENDHVRLEVSVGAPQLLDEGEWDVPLYLDNDWPISVKDLVETPDQQWPESVFGQVLGCQAAVDLYTSLKLVGSKNRERVVMLADAKIAKEQQSRLRNGSSADFIPIDLPAGMGLDQVAKVLNFGTGAAEVASERMFLLREMEATTGTTAQVTGAQDSMAQDRSATATQVRNEATTTRTGDFRTKIEELATDTARKECMAVRLFLEEEEVSPYVPPESIDMFYVRVDMAGVAMPVRDVFDPKDKNKPLTLQEVYPAAATYFPTAVDAMKAAMELWQFMELSDDMRVRELRNSILAGVTPDQIDMETMLPPTIFADPVTVERVWQDTAGMTPEDLMREMTYKVATGTGIKFDKQAEQNNADMLSQTVLPIAVQIGDYAAANAILNRRDEAFDVPIEKRIMFSPPPPPPTQAPGGPEEAR